MRRLVFAATTMAVVFVLVSGATAGVTPTVVKGGEGFQFSGVANTDWLTWSSNSGSRPNHFDALYQPVGGGTIRKMNETGTVGFSGAITGDTTEAIYQQVEASSDLYLFDLETRLRSDPPDGVNTSAWESSPSISPGYILFDRQNNKRWKVMLFDRTAGTSMILDSAGGRCRCVQAGQVSDDYATWVDCSGTRCEVRYYDIAAETAHRFPNPFTKQQYGTGVSSATGNLYAVRSGNGCGANVRIVSWNPVAGGDPVVVASLSTAYDLADSRLLTFGDGGGHDDVYFGRFTCRTGDANLFKLEDADTVVTRVGMGAGGGAGIGSKPARDLGQMPA